MEMMSAISEEASTKSEMCEVAPTRPALCSGPSAGRKRDSLATPSLGSSSSSNSAQNLVQQVRLSSCLCAEPDRSREASSERLFAASSLGNKCGKCQNHEVEVSKKGHARDCPFKKCDCQRCRLLDARSDILQVISGKETKLKGTKKDPNCGFCQNHGIKILRKGHVRSCHFGQERHFRLDNCFDCEVHYIRNEVNRLQIKMRRAMKEDRMLSEEQRKTAREPITRQEVERVCEMARMARKKREATLKAQQVALEAGESSKGGAAPAASMALPRAPRNSPLLMMASPVGPFASSAPAFHQQQERQPHQLQHAPVGQQLAGGVLIKNERDEFSLLATADELDANSSMSGDELPGHQVPQQQHGHLSNLVIHNRSSRISDPAAASQPIGANVWRPWSQQHQQQIVAALATHQQQQPQSSQHTYVASSPPQLITNTPIDASGDSAANFGVPLLRRRKAGVQLEPYSNSTLSPMSGPFQPNHAPTGPLALPIDSSPPIISQHQQQQQQTPLEQQQLLYTIFRVLFDNLHQQQQSQHFNMP